MIRLGILGSTRGTNMLNLLHAIQENRLAASIEIVISNKADAIILERAKAHHLNTKWVTAIDKSREEFDSEISELLKQHHVDLVVLIGYMRILSPQFIAAWKNKIINIHPSLLPAFAGKMDLDVHRAVLESHVEETGCTVHYVTEEVDAGPIILQKTCALFPGDTPETLKERVQALEGEALISAIQKLSA